MVNKREAAKVKESSRAVMFEVGASQKYADRRNGESPKPSLFEKNLRLKDRLPTAHNNDRMPHETEHYHPCGVWAIC